MHFYLYKAFCDSLFNLPWCRTLSTTLLYIGIVLPKPAVETHLWCNNFLIKALQSKCNDSDF